MKCGALKEDEAQRLRALEAENGRLKKIVAEQALDISMLKEVRRRAAVAQATTVVAAISAVISAWTVVASQVFFSGTADSLALASSLAIVGFSLVGLTVHELDSERVVHSLEVSSAKTRSEPVSVA